MKKANFIYNLLGILLLTSCYSLDHMPIEYMVPATINFPREIRSVGIVNNVNPNSEFYIEKSDTIAQALQQLGRKISYHNGNATLGAQSLAESIADQYYFDSVIILDSTLRAHDFHARESVLSQREVTELTEEMNVDMLISLENLQIKATKTLNITPVGFWEIIEAKISPLVRLYIPQRSTPLIEVNASDTIFWEDIQYSESRLNTRSLSEKEVITEASIYSGGIPVKYIIPYWKTENRYLYSGGTSQMRNATHLLNKQQYEEAFKIWENIYNKSSKKKKLQMYAAFNIALYHELNDNFEEAIRWTQLAIEMATHKIDYKSILQNDDYISISNQQLYASYMKALEKRAADAVKLRMQLERFDEDF